MGAIMKLLAATLIAFAATFAASASAIEIKGAGATFPAPLYYSWIQEHSEKHPEVELRYDAVGSGLGVKEFIAGRVDFGGSDAAMTDEEIAKVDGGVVMVPVTAGMVVVAYNLPGFTGPLKLSRKTLTGIFSGRIVKWNDPAIAADNPGAQFPDRTISIVVRRDSSGTTFAFTNHLSAISDSWRDAGPGVGKLIDWPGDAMTAYGNDGVAGRILVTEYSIGYLQYGFAKRLGIPMAELQNQDGKFVAPSFQSGSDAIHAMAGEMPDNGRHFMPDPAGPDSYPIVTYSWLLLRKTHNDPRVSEILRGFIGWAIKEGQEKAKDTGYVPLPEPAAERSLSLLKQAQ